MHTPGGVATAGVHRSPGNPGTPPGLPHRAVSHQGEGANVTGMTFAHQSATTGPTAGPPDVEDYQVSDFLNAYSIQPWLESCPQGYFERTV